jgi:hypothetical protein
MAETGSSMNPQTDTPAASGEFQDLIARDAQKAAAEKAAAEAAAKAEVEALARMHAAVAALMGARGVPEKGPSTSELVAERTMIGNTGADIALPALMVESPAIVAKAFRLASADRNRKFEVSADGTEIVATAAAEEEANAYAIVASFFPTFKKASDLREALLDAHRKANGVKAVLSDSAIKSKVKDMAATALFDAFKAGDVEAVKAAEEAAASARRRLKGQGVKARGKEALFTLGGAHALLAIARNATTIAEGGDDAADAGWLGALTRK